jgi:hypothetical protein
VVDTATLCISFTSLSACTQVDIQSSIAVTCSSTGTTAGKLCFEVLSGICSDHGSTLITGLNATSYTNFLGTGTHTYVRHVSLSTTGLTAGNYIWVVTYAGLTGTDKPPSRQVCEPFKLTAFPPPPSVPEFPLGSVLMMALAIPALLVFRGKFAKNTGPQVP